MQLWKDHVKNSSLHCVNFRCGAEEWGVIPAFDPLLKIYCVHINLSQNMSVSDTPAPLRFHFIIALFRFSTQTFTQPISCSLSTVSLKQHNTHSMTKKQQKKKDYITCPHCTAWMVCHTCYASVPHCTHQNTHVHNQLQNTKQKYYSFSILHVIIFNKKLSYSWAAFLVIAQWIQQFDSTHWNTHLL